MVAYGPLRASDVARRQALTPEEIAHELALVDGLDRANVWLRRGDGIAVYENGDLGHPEVGHLQFLSFGSGAAMFEHVDHPPDRLPDMCGRINWRYRLVAEYRGEPLTLKGEHHDEIGSR